MPGPETPITDSEKAAILAYCFGIFGTWRETFLAAEAGKPTTRKAESLNSVVTRWKQYPKIQKYIEYCTRLIADRDADARQRGRDEEIQRRQEEEEKGMKEGESNRTQKRKPAPIDYNNPEARRQLYNRIISEAADDPKTQLDAAKLIEQTQRDDRQAAQDNKIQRVYMPVTCQTCPIFEKARTKGR